PLWSNSGASLTPRLSPDGNLLAYSANDLFTYDLRRSVANKLTNTAASNRYPVWMPDGKHIIFSSTGGEYAIWWVRADGSSQPQKLFSAKEILLPGSVSPDGRRLVFALASIPSEIWMLPLDLADPDHPKPGTAELLLHEDHGVGYPAISPDGRWLAY